MTLDHLQFAPQYYCLHPLFRAAFEYFQGFDPATPDGKHDLKGDDLFMLVQTFDTAPAWEKNFEAHQRYIDIQYVVSGQETIYYQAARLLAPRTEYDSKKDFQFYHGSDEFPLRLNAGDFTILWPQDGHKPSCVWDKTCHVRKIVAKIRL